MNICAVFSPFGRGARSWRPARSSCSSASTKSRSRQVEPVGNYAGQAGVRRRPQHRPLHLGLPVLSWGRGPAAEVAELSGPAAKNWALPTPRCCRKSRRQFSAKPPHRSRLHCAYHPSVHSADNNRSSQPATTMTVLPILPPPSRPPSFGYQQVPVAEKQARVRAVFESVAGNYDLMNDLMSAGTHRLWKRFTLSQTGLRPGQRALDVAGGTGRPVARACASRWATMAWWC